MKEFDELDILADKRVLCADDNPGILKEISEILEMFFNEVVAVDDGEKAFDEAINNQFDVLIFDISMPKLDGLDAIKKIREHNKKIPVIVLSAHTEQEYLWRAVDLKISKYLTKPFDKKALISALEQVALELVDYNMTIKLTNTSIYNYCTKQLDNNGKFIQLSKSESRLLEFFLKNKNIVLTFDNILDYMWDYDKPTKEAVKAIVKELRKKINGDFITNIYGLGYKCEI